MRIVLLLACILSLLQPAFSQELAAAPTQEPDALEADNPWPDGALTGPRSSPPTGQPYTPEAPPNNVDAGRMQTYPTMTQGARHDQNPNGPILAGTPGRYSQGPGESGAVTSAPYPGSFKAPGNIALKVMKGACKGLDCSKLPPTRLDSFVHQSGYDDKIYGDEGGCGAGGCGGSPPPYNNFTEEHRIERGIERSCKSCDGLTTGHPSDAPDAWGWPQ